MTLNMIYVGNRILIWYDVRNDIRYLVIISRYITRYLVSGI